MIIYEFILYTFDLSLKFILWSVRLYLFYLMISEIKFKINGFLIDRKRRKRQ